MISSYVNGTISFFPHVGECAVELFDLHVSNDSGVAVGGREVGKEPGVMPVSHSGHHHPLDVFHHILPGVRVLGGLAWDQGPQVTRLDLGQNVSLANVLQNNFSKDKL